MWLSFRQASVQLLNSCVDVYSFPRVCKLRTLRFMSQTFVFPSFTLYTVQQLLQHACPAFNLCLPRPHRR